MLTRKQHELLMFIHERLKESGIPPSFDEMKDALDLRSKSGIHRLIRALEEREVLYHLMEPTRHRKAVCITIGDEMPVKELRHCSVVAGSYRFGEFGGSIGVIGPTRMSYDHVVALVDYVATAVGGVLARN